ncbi:MAG: DUF3883 domain-containing protein [Clostridia bacterium]|nr:DUF3883 domain-containing protein [Clostridia bacterium]
MLEELKNLNIPFGKKEILYFFTKVLGNRSVSRKDIKTLFSHAPGMKMDVDAAIKYALTFSWIYEPCGIAINENLVNYLDDDELLNSKLIDYTVKKLFNEGYFSEQCFSFTITGEGFRFRNELFPIEFSAVRDVLVNQGFFVAKKSSQITQFYVAPRFEEYLANFLKESRIKLTLEDLKKKLEVEALAGEKAENFVLAFEKNRLSKELAKRVQRISAIDVGAGYDIISFLDNSSTDYDCYIEVKAISRDFEFYWSKNEYETAKFYGEHYKLYLVDLSKISDISYYPCIVDNPAETVIKSDDWLLTPQSFHVQKIF